MKPITRILAVLAVVLSTFSVSNAIAAPREPAFVNVESIQARSEGRGSYVIDFRIQPRSLEWLQQNAIAAEWQIETSDRRRFSIRSRIETTEGQIRFRLRGADAEELFVRVTGRGPRHRLEWMELAGTRLTQVGLPVFNDMPPPRPDRPWGPGGEPDRPSQPPPSHAGPNWAAEPNVISACGFTFDNPQSEIACLDAVRPYRENPSAAIRACDFAMDSDEAELDCVKASARIRGDVQRIVQTCDFTMDSDKEELVCIREAARARFDPIGTIRACDFAMDSDATEIDCIRIAMGASQDPTSALKACERGMGGDAEELACFRRGIVR